MTDNNSDHISELIQRAKKAGRTVDSSVDQYGDEYFTYHYVSVPSSGNNRQFYFQSDDEAKKILKFDFENYLFVGDYEAIFNLSSGDIEAVIISRDFANASMLERQLGLRSSARGAHEADQGIEESDSEILEVSTPECARLEISRATDKLILLGLNTSRFPLTLKISLGKPQTEESALIALEVISNSLFFQIDLELGLSLSLRRSLRRPRRLRARKRGTPKQADIQFPSYEYDSAPISLYWYAKSARGMPLLQFVAFYQVAEYYFPNFARLEAVRSARKILKNPTFRVDRESDLTRLITSISGAGRVGGSEREQMRSTVLEVVTIDDVAQYFDENPDVAEYVSKKQKGITDKTIYISRKDHDHRPEIADLLYDIRCKIVHTKNDHEALKSEMLLPFSSAEDGLWAYIDLMQLVARHALIRSSTVMRNF